MPSIGAALGQISSILKKKGLSKLPATANLAPSAGTPFNAALARPVQQVIAKLPSIRTDEDATVSAHAALGAIASDQLVLAVLEGVVSTAPPASRNLFGYRVVRQLVA